MKKLYQVAILKEEDVIIEGTYENRTLLDNYKEPQESENKALEILEEVLNLGYDNVTILTIYRK